MGSRTLIIAGATGYGVWPANTLEGARRCLAAPVDGFEIDVQITADGHVVAHHDYRLSPDATRLDGKWLEAPGPPLKEMTLTDLRRYDVGSLRPGSKSAARHPYREMSDGEPVPTIRELLSALRDARGPKRLIYIEIKTDPTQPGIAPDPAAVVDAVADDVEAAGWVEHTKIIAFDWQVPRLARRRNPGLATAHLTIPAALAINVRPLPDGASPWTDGLDVASRGSELAAIGAHGGEEWSPYFTEVTPERVAEAATLGLRVGPWGLSTEDDIRRAEDLGVFSATASGPSWGPERDDDPAWRGSPDRRKGQPRRTESRRSVGEHR